ncbi:AraC family transcriptional regulator [Rhizobium sp. TRM95111]|uniref:AraC family transcriptional regulator n=1 Tax=Rhizobium alarense TaxID=2846851 RepID=UPI001F3E4F06|nr:AraC family transcriptional regulator [Rhizobium alarense]MCF3641602.1 AraC family transcriptional regulator [Rhizobium alarense]
MSRGDELISGSGEAWRNGNHFQSHGSDAEALAEALSSPSSRISVKSPKSASLSFECEFATAHWLSIGYCRYEGDLVVERETATDKLIIFLPRKGTSLIELGKGEALSAPGRGIIVDSTTQKGLRSSGIREHLALIIDTPELRRRLASRLQNGCSGSLGFVPEIDLTRGGGQVLDQLAQALHVGLCKGHALRQAPLALNAMTESMAQLLLEAVPHRYSTLLDRCVSMPVPRHVRRAIDYMHEHIGDAITLEDLARISSVSTRTLQLGFKQFKESSPMSYLQSLRLEKVHGELKTACSGQTVADIALKWGFTHLGRFAAEYRERFGERPSATLRTPVACSERESDERVARPF